ncbi:MAG TPA: response regulator [Rectinemataceae bacterium]|nr:response regulator [Rectinemataceae bacterium]
MAVDMSKFIGRFVEESRERIAQLIAGIGAFDIAEAREGEGSAVGGVDELFRAAHTIKGSAKMLGQAGIGETAHRLEDLLDALRSGRLKTSSEAIQALYRGADGLSSLVERLASGEKNPPADEAVLKALAAVIGTEEASPEVESREKAAAPVGSIAALAATEASTVQAQIVPESVRVRIEKLDELVRLTGEALAARAQALSRSAELAAIEHMAFPATASDTDRLRMIRERIGQYRRKLRADALAREDLDGELHAAALAMRMLPLSIVFEPAARMAREIARSLGKEIECAVSGEGIELDRQIIDRLGEPLLHLLRNAIDHGIEAPELRESKGKPRRGRIGLSARRAEGSVYIEVSDDGGGLDIEAIREKALRVKIVTPDKAATLSTREISDLIFLPGFSTSPMITDLSGRGVGLDVVRKTVVESLKGTIFVDSTPGTGVSFRLRLPPTLAIMRVLFARSGEAIFAFASHDVTGVVDIDPKAILDIAGGKAAIIRNEFVPVMALAEALSLPETSEAFSRSGGQAGADAGLRLLVVNDGSERLALAIDSLVDEREAVVKPLPPHMRGVSLVSGIVTIGSNELICLLNAPALVGSARRERVSSPARDSAVASRARKAEILVIDDSLNTREIERDVLESHGYRITLAEDGTDGLAKALAKKFDAVLTDVEMPGLDGFALTERLRAEEAYRDAPIVILTSRSREEDRRRGIRAGADAYIVKGDFEQGGLLETLRSLGL